MQKILYLIVEQNYDIVFVNSSNTISCPADILLTQPNLRRQACLSHHQIVVWFSIWLSSKTTILYLSIFPTIFLALLLTYCWPRPTTEDTAWGQFRQSQTKHEARGRFFVGNFWLFILRFKCPTKPKSKPKHLVFPFTTLKESIQLKLESKPSTQTEESVKQDPALLENSFTSPP